MFTWLSRLVADFKEDEISAARPALNFELLQREETAVVFNHSRSCPVSWAANRQVRKFAASHPTIPVYTVTIQDDRELSRRVAAWTAVRHESPQVIILRHGKVVAAASHEAVTSDYLASAVRE